MKTLKIRDGVIHLAESKAICPKCAAKIPFDKIEKKWMKQDNCYMRMKCVCKRYIGIATDMRGDFIAFDFDDA